MTQNYLKKQHFIKFSKMTENSRRLEANVLNDENYRRIEENVRDYEKLFSRACRRDCLR